MTEPFTPQELPGGAFEDDLQQITQLSEDQWAELRRSLLGTGLIQIEQVPGVNPPWLTFHPTLAPALWPLLSGEQQAGLTARHREWYYRLPGYLDQQDQKNPQATRAIARRILPDLLHAVHGALDAGEAWAVGFAGNVSRFLGFFGLTRDRTALVEKVPRAAGEIGSEAWYLACNSRGEQLFDAGHYGQAQRAFAAILSGLGEGLSYRRCLTLHWLGRCHGHQGRGREAEACYREALGIAEGLEQGDPVRRETGVLQNDLADLLAERGDFGGARAAYEAALETAEDQIDERQRTVVTAQLGNMALRRGDPLEAERRYKGALAILRRELEEEPETEAVLWHQLGMVNQRTAQLEAAEAPYREAASIRERIGLITGVNGAAATWDHLAQVMQLSARPTEAEAWYRKALDARRQVGERPGLSITLSNLADLLQQQPGRLSEARTLAEESLSTSKTLDPAAAEIWKTYNILAGIAEKQGDQAAARNYRRRLREAQTVFMGTRHELRRRRPLIAAVVSAVAQPAQRSKLEPALDGMIEHGWDKLVIAIRRILDGERDQDGLCEPLDGKVDKRSASTNRHIAHTILISMSVRWMRCTYPPAQT